MKMASTEYYRLTSHFGCCFPGVWNTRFIPRWWQRKFTLRTGQRVKKRFMSVKASFAYLETDTLRLAVIPYKEGHFSMVVAIPRNVKKFIGT